MLDTYGAHLHGTDLLTARRRARHPRPTARYLPRHAKEGDPALECRSPGATPDVYLVAMDYLDKWYPSRGLLMRPLLSAFAHDGQVAPELCDELANELLDCPPDHARARDLVALATLMVEFLTPR